MNTLEWLELHQRGFDAATAAAYDKAAAEGRLDEFLDELIARGYRPPEPTPPKSRTTS